MAVPYIFATKTAQIPLGDLDTNFATPITIGSSSISLGSTANSIVGLTSIAIGTASPAASLDVRGTTYISSSLTVGGSTSQFGPVSSHGGPNIYFVNTSGQDGSGASLVMLNNNSTGTQKTAAYINPGFLIATAGAEQGLIDFSVLDGTNSQNRIIAFSVDSGGVSASITPSDNNYWTLGLSGYRFSNAYLVNGDFSGKVGIGTSSPKTTLQINGSLGRTTPVVKTVNFTLADTENWIVCNGSGTITVTLPSASSWTGREVMFKNIAAQTVVSSSANVVPMNGGAIGTAMLPATISSWITLVSNGAEWLIMQEKT